MATSGDRRSRPVPLRKGTNRTSAWNFGGKRRSPPLDTQKAISVSVRVRGVAAIQSTIVNDCLLYATAACRARWGLTPWPGPQWWQCVAPTSTSTFPPSPMACGRSSRAVTASCPCASGDSAGAASLAIGTTSSGRRAVPVVAHIVVDPADPAFAHPDGALDPAPLGVLEAEAIAALVGLGFPVVVTGHVPVAPRGYLSTRGGGARRCGGGTATGLRISVPWPSSFVVDDDWLRVGDGPAAGEIDVVEVEGWLAAEPRVAPELRAAVRFLRAGGQLAVVTTSAHAATRPSSTAPTAPGRCGSTGNCPDPAGPKPRCSPPGCAEPVHIAGLRGAERRGNPGDGGVPPTKAA